MVFDGRRIDGLKPHRILRLGLARTFQKETSFAKLTVAQNVRLGGFYGAGLRGRALEAAVAATLDLFGLAPFGAALAGTLPVHQTKHLMIASAMVARPKLLLLDEPASGLNAVEQGELQRLILRLRDEGTSILLIEHILPLLFGVSERVMVMDFGRKLTEGPPSDIAKDPRVIEAYLGGKAMESLHAA